MEIEEKKYSIFQNVIYLIKESLKYDRRILIYSIIAIITGVVIPVFGIYLPKAAVDLLTEHADIQRIAIVLGGIVTAMLVIRGVGAYFGSSRYYFYNSMRKYFMRKLFFRSLDSPYAYNESGECRQKYERAFEAVAWGDNSGPTVFYNKVPECIISIICFLLYSSILSTLHIAVVILLLVSALIIYFFERREAACYERTMDEYAKAGRRLRYTRDVCDDVKMGKDIRVYDMGNWLTGLMRLLQGRREKVLKKRLNQEYVTQIVGCVLNFLRDGIAYAYLIYMTLKGHIGMGDFMLYFGAITGFSDWVIQIIWNIGSIKTGNIQVNYIRTFLEIPAEDIEKAECRLPNISDGVEIEFSHVSFSYPDSDKETIRDLSFHIKKGERVAVVGTNGAGKTTLVKLMTGLYKPTEGVIRINGTDISKISKKDVYSLYSAVFQDIMILPFRLDENIALKVREEIDEERVEEVLKLAGLYEELVDRKISQDSYMTQMLSKDGVTLSGGQQQKFLLARALYKEAPILVLDEPTAALDPLAEKEMYEKYEKLCVGKTALFISHRLASTQFSDRIFFMKDGCIAECGSHEQLLDNGGEYAHMFEVQSYYYNVDNEVREEAAAWK